MATGLEFAKGPIIFSLDVSFINGIKAKGSCMH